ncbi:MAG: TraI domain-containing protein [Alphaproteobacteria bacterium]|nr:TraI domain-containing protein [Alphaproteobacteria bacterium]
MFGFPKRGLVASPVVAIDDDLLSYPPTPKGMPVVDPVALLDRQRDILGKIKEALPPLGWSEFDVLIRPTLNNVAAFVHLLPASEQDHHRLAGGLLRHLLESARWASQFALNRVFEPFGDPRRRRETEPRWHVAVALAGLLHDIGKPVTDMEVTTVQGHAWNPLEESLYAWAQKNRIERYYIRFRTGRHERHETLPSLMFGQVVARDLQTWLAEPGPEIIQAMSVTLAGGNAGTDEKIRALRHFQEKGDFASVAEDKQRSGILFSNPSMGLPLQNYMIAAMSSLIDDGSWTVNRPGSRLWRLRLPDGDEGLYIVWKKGAQEVEQRARQMQMPGVPSDPVRAAAVLLETGVAIPWPAETGDNRSYWPIAPEALRGVVLLSVRLRTLDLFRNLPMPEAVEGVLVPRKADGDGEVDGADAPREPDAAPLVAVAPADELADVNSPPSVPPHAPESPTPPTADPPARAAPQKKRESAPRHAPPAPIPEPTAEPAPEATPAPARPDPAPSIPDKTPLPSCPDVGAREAPGQADRRAGAGHARTGLRRVEQRLRRESGTASTACRKLGRGRKDPRQCGRRDCGWPAEVGPSPRARGKADRHPLSRGGATFQGSVAAGRGRRRARYPGAVRSGARSRSHQSAAAGADGGQDQGSGLEAGSRPSGARGGERGGRQPPEVGRRPGTGTVGARHDHNGGERDGRHDSGAARATETSGAPSRAGSRTAGAAVTERGAIGATAGAGARATEATRPNATPPAGLGPDRGIPGDPLGRGIGRP